MPMHPNGSILTETTSELRSQNAILAEVPESKRLRFDGLTIENCHIKDSERGAYKPVFPKWRITSVLH